MAASPRRSARARGARHASTRQMTLAIIHPRPNGAPGGEVPMVRRPSPRVVQRRLKVHLNGAHHVGGALPRRGARIPLERCSSAAALHSAAIREGVAAGPFLRWPSYCQRRPSEATPYGLCYHYNGLVGIGTVAHTPLGWVSKDIAEDRRFHRGTTVRGRGVAVAVVEDGGSIFVTLDTYSHVLLGMGDAAGAMDEAHIRYLSAAR